MMGVPVTLFLVAAAIITTVFTLVARSTRAPDEVDYSRANRLRRVFFLSLATVLAIFLALTLPQLPYPADAAEPAQVVNVVGKQYAFSLTTGPGPDSLDNWDRDYSPMVQVRPGTPVEFRVTTLDVNHGFSVYAPDGRLLAQTQAMPGYVNRLRVQFDQPGTYRVLCLEFCGMAHHAMNGTIDVTGAAAP
jgi:cytochrome c oxidase subunit 2